METARTYRGILRRVAERSGRSITHVHYVLLGHRELTPELARIFTDEILQMKRASRRSKQRAAA